MFNKNKFALILFCFLIFVSISSVCAGDNTNLTVSHIRAADVSIYDNATFGDLQNDIGNLNSGDVYNIKQDYVFNSDGENTQSTDISNHSIDVCADDVTINGNGHVIDGNYKTAIFKVSGNNVKLFNLTFINCKSTDFNISSSDENDNSSSLISTVDDGQSPIFWTGDNGLISDCIFSHSAALNGGAITWAGNNGLINNSLFINTVARGVGGAIFMAGTKNTVANTMFINSTSQLAGEAIYFDKKSRNTTFSNCNYDNNIFMIDGNFTGIDVDYYLKQTYYSQVGDKYIDLVPIMYKAIMGGFIRFDDDLFAYVQYSNSTRDFTLGVIRNFKEFNISYQKNYIFTNTTLNDAFESLINGSYKNNLILTKSLSVNNTKEYESVCHCNHDIIGNNEPFINSVVPDLKELEKNSNFLFENVVFALNVFYAPGSVFESNAQWSENNGFGVVNIFGNGAKIKASSKDRDENKWIVTVPEQVYMVYDLTVEGFNTAICNKEGYCVLNNVNLNNNRMDYIKDKDDGAAILNGGVVFCSNCAFNNNYAKNGGAIFSQGLLSLDNCTFNANHGYGVGDDVLNVDQGIVLLNGQQITGSKGPITYVKSMSSIASKIISALAIAGTVIAGVGSGIAATVATGGNIVFGVGFGVGVGISVGGVLGVGAACAIAPHLYNLAFDRITVAESIVYTCVVAGIFSGFIGGAVAGPFFVKNAPNIGKIPVERELESVVNQELESVVDNEAGSVVNKEVESIVNKEVKVQPVEEPSLGEQLEYNSDFWGPIRSRYVPVQKEAPVIENPRVPVIENPEIPAEDLNIVEEKSLEIKNFNKLRMCSREKISKLINSRNAYSFKVDCQECTCKVANDWGEIKDLFFSEGKFLSKFYARYINTAGEQIDVIFTFDINFDLIRVVELG